MDKQLDDLARATDPKVARFRVYKLDATHRILEGYDVESADGEAAYDLADALIAQGWDAEVWPVFERSTRRPRK